MLYIIDPVTDKTLAIWHQGEKIPEVVVNSRVVKFQADGDELFLLTVAMLNTVSRKDTRIERENSLKDRCDGCCSCEAYSDKVVHSYDCSLI